VEKGEERKHAGRERFFQFRSRKGRKKKRKVFLLPKKRTSRSKKLKGLRERGRVPLFLEWPGSSYEGTYAISRKL